MSKQKVPVPMYSAFGIAGQAGCLVTLLVVASLFVGIGVDAVLKTKPVFTLLLVIGSAPVSLWLTLQITQRLITRMIPPDTQPASGKDHRTNTDLADPDDEEHGKAS